MTCCGPPFRSRAAAPPAALVGKLCSSKRQQNALTAAIKEYGALRRTVYARHLANAIYPRRIARQLNKGENLHSLRSVRACKMNS
jgi:TnpA family transposase